MSELVPITARTLFSHAAVELDIEEAIAKILESIKVDSRIDKVRKLNIQVVFKPKANTTGGLDIECHVDTKLPGKVRGLIAVVNDNQYKIDSESADANQPTMFSSEEIPNE